MKIMKLLISGICWGCTICVFILMIGVATVGDSFLDMCWLSRILSVMSEGAPYTG